MTAKEVIALLEEYTFFSEELRASVIDANIVKSVIENTYIDNIKTKKSLVRVPNEFSNINQNAFNEWMAYKKYKNKGAITKTLNMLNKYDFQTQQEMVDKSIMNEYKGLFEPKRNNQSHQPYNTPKSQVLNTNVNIWDEIDKQEAMKNQGFIDG